MNLRKISKRVAFRRKESSMKTPEDLAEINGYVKIEVSSGVKVQYVDENDKTYIDVGPPQGIVFGHVTAAQKSSDGECYNAYSVMGTEASSGWGPLLYDIVLEYASKDASGLTSHREMVSEDAYNIWETYLESRTDVEARQLDDLDNTLTPKEIDNCKQNILDSYGQDLRESPLAKVYFKSNTPRMDKLDSLGRLIYGSVKI